MQGVFYLESVLLFIFILCKASSDIKKTWWSIPVSKSTSFILLVTIARKYQLIMPGSDAWFDLTDVCSNGGPGALSQNRGRGWILRRIRWEVAKPIAWVQIPTFRLACKRKSLQIEACSCHAYGCENISAQNMALCIESIIDFVQQCKIFILLSMVQLWNQNTN